jgi:hypothetical protein
MHIIDVFTNGHEIQRRLWDVCTKYVQVNSL